MGFLSSLSKAAPVEKAEPGLSSEAGFVSLIGGGARSATGLTISQRTALGVSAVYACATIRAQDVARCTPILNRRDARGRKVAVTDHPVARVFRRPNAVQTWFEFMEQAQLGYLLRGNAYAPVKPDRRGDPLALIPVNPDGVTIMESIGGEIFFNVARIGQWQMAMLAEFPQLIHSSNMLHLRGPGLDVLFGLSTIGLARDAIGLAMGLEQQSARFMANGARPSLVLESEKTMGDDAAKRLGVQFREQFGGVNKTGGIPVLEDGLKAHQLQLTSVDLEFMKQRDFQILDILRFWRMPPYKVGIGSPGANRAQADQDYVSNTIMPDLHRWEQKFDQVFGLAATGLEVDLDERVLLRADIATRYTTHRIGLLSGFLKPNEVREEEDREPVEGGDEVYRPLNMAALGSDATGAPADGAGHPTDAEGGVPGADNVPTKDFLPKEAAE